LKFSGAFLWSIVLVISSLLLSSGSNAIDINIDVEIDSSHGPEISSTLNSIQPSPENVYNEIESLSAWYRYLDTSGHRAAENYIFSKFESYGLNTSRMEYTVRRLDGDVRGANVLGLLEGSCPDKWLVIGGHYDANQKSPYGAYDNAAGAGTVLELARFFSEFYNSNDGPAISILFATWDAEEGGGAGSKYFVDNVPAEIEIVAYINLDMYSLNYPIRNSIPGSTEDYFRLYLYTSPVDDFSGYTNTDFNESTLANFTVFKTLLQNITYDENNLPPEWVPVLDDTETISDHSHFIRKSIPAVWFRGMNEYPRDEGDLNERNFKHTPVDTLATMERYAGGKAELLKGIDTGLTIAYQLALRVLNLTSCQAAVSGDGSETNGAGSDSGLDANGWLIAIVVTFIVILFLYYYISRIRAEKIKK
jgi:hypothetical protein